MPEGLLTHWALTTIVYASALFIFVIGTAALIAVVVYVIDRAQTANAIRRNFPVVGRLRYLFEHLGVFFRQYFFAMDREELPFNRAQRRWVDSASLGESNTHPFGSTRDMRLPGTVMFANSPFARMSEDAAPAAALTIGPDCPTPYAAPSFFNVSGMSYGSISMPAVRALSRGAAAAGIWLDTGEGGLSDWHLEGGGDIVFQIGTAKYGVRTLDGDLDEKLLRRVAERPTVRMFEIKLSQGAKPGKGGILPAIKVTEEIARVRNIPQGRDSVSPNRFPEIANTGELLDFVARVRPVTGKPVGIKTVIGDPDWLDEFCSEIERRGAASAPDFITVDSADGGTGASPLPLLDYTGILIADSLPLTCDKLEAHGLRQRIKVIASGKLMMPGPVAWALAAGADFVQSARGFMFALGCIQAMQCNRNTCPTGVTTHNPRLQRGLVVPDKATRVAAYARNVVREVGIIAHSCGLDDPRQLSRHHCWITGADGRPRRLSELFPPVQPGQAPAAG